MSIARWIAGFLFRRCVGISGAVVFMLGAAAAVAGSPSAPIRGNIAEGRDTFQVCAVCHLLNDSGVSTTGPNLYGVIGRKVGKLPGFHYSPALADSNRVWTVKLLDAWLEDPQKALPGNRMPFTGLKSDADRKNVIAYIKSVSRARHIRSSGRDDR